jgi:hypothetical protein
MRRKRLLFMGVVALLVPVAAAGIALAGSPRSETTVASEATAAFHDVGKALAAGYAPSDFPGLPGSAECFQSAEGGMGIHYINGAYLTDGVIDAAKPEALVYEPRENGKLKLVALEYVIFQSDSPGGAPSLFGDEFAPNDGVALGVPPLYTLHAWIWQPNPTGLLEPWNPTVQC